MIRSYRKKLQRRNSFAGIKEFIVDLVLQRYPIFGGYRAANAFLNQPEEMISLQKKKEKKVCL